MIVRRGALTDHYVEDERSVVMVDESVLGLSPVATAILEAVPEGVDVGLPAVTKHVVATFGPPAGTESAEALTEQQIWDLVAHRVLVVVEGDDHPAREASPHGTERRPGPVGDDPEGAVTALRDALRHLRSDDNGRWAAPDSLTPRGLVVAARQHHVVPYLAANLDRLDIPGQARSELEAAAGRQHAGAVMLAADLALAIETLREANVRALAFKGVTLAAQAYGDFRTRGTGDLDLLVAPQDLARAHLALTKSGWHPASGYPAPGPSWAWRHFGRTGNELTFLGTHSDIDLHWHLVPTRGTFPDFDTLWSRRAAAVVAGHPTPTLSPYDALAHSAGHAAKDGWRWLRSLLDVHHLASQPSTWSSVDRPLRGDQMLSLGLAVRMFGPTNSSPADLEKACVMLTNRVWDSVMRQQVATGEAHRAFRVAGPAFVHNLRGLVRTGAPIRETARLISRSVFPVWHTSEELSPHAVVAAPRALARRASEVAHRLRHL
ncbi:nucleotidyltransferase family protein [Nocardioides cavernae]|uniref:Nucleotidyltransferase family protein n=1 Tax=Nocardioides cavernae TaxID=1921566 RepID=A0ABR8N5L5_9ACTN|nr:nucleotidyltransferase family protein [Nocardioides cavernae]MBD3923457.1 nucleotidyltransferase family protein [Nocardioides cavernae]MBM7511617.1 hypothetical protein [Nocardioides cavernae]